MIIAFSKSFKNSSLPHTHKVHELVMGCTGSAWVSANGQRYEVGRRQTILIPAGTSHHYEIDRESGTAKMVFICFDEQAIEEKCFEFALQASLGRIFNNTISSAQLDSETAKETAHLVRMLMRTLECIAPFSREKSGNLFSSILLNHISAIANQEKSSTDVKFQDMQRVLKWIGDNLSEPICIDHAAKKCHMSRSAFTRYFKKYTNCTFSQFVTNARLKLAGNLLLQESLSIGEIAFHSGYKNMGHFYTQFQRHYGVTPSQYRNVSIAISDDS